MYMYVYICIREECLKTQVSVTRLANLKNLSNHSELFVSFVIFFRGTGSWATTSRFKKILLEGIACG